MVIVRVAGRPWASPSIDARSWSPQPAPLMPSCSSFWQRSAPRRPAHTPPIERGWATSGRISRRAARSKAGNRHTSRPRRSRSSSAGWCANTAESGGRPSPPTPRVSERSCGSSPPRAAGVRRQRTRRCARTHARSWVGARYKTPRIDQRLPLIVPSVLSLPIPPPSERRGARRLEVFARPRPHPDVVLHGHAPRRGLAAGSSGRPGRDVGSRADHRQGRQGPHRLLRCGDTQTAIRAYLEARHDTLAPLFLRHDNHRGGERLATAVRSGAYRRNRCGYRQTLRAAVRHPGYDASLQAHQGERPPEPRRQPV